MIFTYIKEWPTKFSFFVLFAGATTLCARCGYADNCTGFEGTYVYYSQLHCMNARTVMSRGESFELRISCSPPLQELPGVLTHLGELREFYDPDTVELMSWIMYVELAFVNSGNCRDTLVFLE